MPNQTNHTEEYSEDVQEILGKVPSVIIRWGVTVFFLILVSILTGSYFLKYPQTISSQVKLTTINPPSPIISNTGGRIKMWQVADQESVRKGQIIAILESDASYEEIFGLYTLLDTIQPENWTYLAQHLDLPAYTQLGQVEKSFQAFENEMQKFEKYLIYGVIPQEIKLRRQKLQSLKEQFQIREQQWELKKKEFELSQSIYKIDSSSYFEGGYGVIRTDYERSLQTYYTNKSSMLAFKSTLMNARVNLLEEEQSILELELNEKREIDAFIIRLDEALLNLITALEGWVSRYVLTAPIPGKLTLTNYWSESQVINPGERVATIVPEEETIIIARAFLSSFDLGRVREGQHVKIKLSGFPYMEYGVIEGEVGSISLVPEEQGYLARINLVNGMNSNYGEKLKFIQEMDGTAEITTQDSRLLFRFLNPLRSFFN